MKIIRGSIPVLIVLAFVLMQVGVSARLCGPLFLLALLATLIVYVATVRSSRTTAH